MSLGYLARMRAGITTALGDVHAESTGGPPKDIRFGHQTVQFRSERPTMDVNKSTTALYTPDKSVIELLHATAGSSTNIQAYSATTSDGPVVI